MKTNKEPVKAKIKAKAKATKEKVKGKLKGAKACAIAAALLALGLGVVGCASANPASRATSNEIGDVEPDVKVVLKNSSSNTVSVTVTTTFGDGALASADSEGSTETQTATPTIDIRTKIDARYNDALAAASTASRSVLGMIGDGVSGVLDLMSSKKTGTVKVTKTDGTPATVKCEDGQCSFCEDCEYN